jgi:hypothetical protein
VPIRYQDQRCPESNELKIALPTFSNFREHNYRVNYFHNANLPQPLIIGADAVCAGVSDK